MRGDEFIDAVQTMGIVISSSALIYIIVRIEMTIRVAARDIAGVMNALREVHRRLDTLEAERFARTLNPAGRSLTPSGEARRE
jgi:hypothetical protein